MMYVIYFNDRPLQFAAEGEVVDRVGEHYYSPMFADRQTAEAMMAAVPELLDMDVDLADALLIVELKCD